MIEDILAKLDKVRRTGSNNWIACCPAHDDKSPSLTIHAADDGRILVKCHAECGFEQIKDAVGLGWEPWFPLKPKSDFVPAVRRPYPAADVLEALSHELMVVLITASDMHKNRAVSGNDMARLIVAHGRIEEGRRLALGGR